MMLLTKYSAENLTPKDLARMLRGVFGDVTIDDVAVEPIGTGQLASTYRVCPQYSGGANTLPNSFIAKTSSTDAASRRLAQSSGVYLREVRFYQQLARFVQTRVPHCYYSEIIDDAVDFILLLEDFSPASSVDQLSGCNVSQAMLAVGQAAKLHGPSWHPSRLTKKHWLPLEATWKPLIESIPHLIDPWLERYGNFLDSEHMQVITELGVQAARWHTTLSDHRCLCHGDFRVDNLLFDAQHGAVAVAVLDWQSVSAAPGILDVSYFLGTSLTPEDRLVHERNLVREYRQQLVAHGVSGYSEEQCWREYQAHAVYGLVLTIPTSLQVQQTERGDSMFAQMARRAADQIQANESFRALLAISPAP